jgi:glucose-6-phosphate isomerase
MSGFEINHKGVSQTGDQALSAHIKSLSAYRDSLQEVVASGSYNEPESALRLPSDDELMESVVRTVSEMTRQYNPKVVVVVGMGGSVRGTRAVYDLVADQATAEVVFLNTVTPHQISRAVDTINFHAEQPADFAICTVSKSGTTTETIANTNILVDKLVDSFNRDAVIDRLLAITSSDSQLEHLAEEHDFNVINLPDQVGGRFSVLSAVGLAPLLLAGLDIRELQSGALSMREACLSGRPTSDPAAALASILYDHSQSSRRILNHFFFNQEAQGLGDWAAQLFAESLGKSTNRQGEPVFAGLYPTTSIGPDDLHSLFQLQLGGPKNFFSIIVRERTDNNADLSLTVGDEFLVDKLDHINGKSLGQIRTALGKAVTEAFKDAGRPFVDITVPQFTLERISQFILLEELVVMYLGDLMNINAFNQPQVETYKDTTRELLESNSS